MGVKKEPRRKKKKQTRHRKRGRKDPQVGAIGTWAREKIQRSGAGEKKKKTCKRGGKGSNEFEFEKKLSIP